MDSPAKEDFGTVAYKDMALKLVQQAHVADDGFKYQAIAVDDDEQEYLVTWPVKDFYLDSDEEFPLPEDESEACDWHVYTVRKL